jgi:uncharacterized protein (TIGR03067 family)
MLSLPILVVVLAAPAAKDGSKPDLAKQIVGEWALESLTLFGGEADKPDDDNTFVFIFRADGTWTRKIGDKKRGVVSDTGTYKLDATKNPAELDLRLDKDKDKPDLPAIIKPSGDVLTICTGQKGGPHPKAFKATKEDLTMLHEFKRVKKDK